MPNRTAASRIAAKSIIAGKPLKISIRIIYRFIFDFFILRKVVHDDLTRLKW